MKDNLWKISLFCQFQRWDNGIDYLRGIDNLKKEEFCEKFNLPENRFDDVKESIAKHRLRVFDEFGERKKFTITELKVVAERFLKKYGGIVSGSAALAFYNHEKNFIPEFIPNDIDVFFSKEGYLRAKRDLKISKQYEDHDYGETFKIDMEVLYCFFEDVEFNLVYNYEESASESTRKFDVECCRLIWDSSLEDPFSKSDRLCIEYNKITYPHRFLSRIPKYLARGFDIMIIDDPDFLDREFYSDVTRERREIISP